MDIFSRAIFLLDTYFLTQKLYFGVLELGPNVKIARMKSKWKWLKPQTSPAVIFCPWDLGP